MNKRFYKDLLIAFFSQGISLVMSLFMSFVVPKFLGVKEYSYWQLFIFYVGYVGFFHYGYNDGVYLRLGGKNYSELDFSGIGTQFKLFLIIETITAILLISVSFFLVSDTERRFVWFAVGLYLVINNITLLLGYIFQAVNKTKIFSISVMIDRIFIVFAIVIILVSKIDGVKSFVAVYLLGKIIAFIYCVFWGRDLVFSKTRDLKVAWKELCLNCCVGIKLTIANIMSLLILGIGQITIDSIWGIESFGKISFALSLTSFFLVFIQQISMVLFPALRKESDQKRKAMYNTLRLYLGMFLPVIFVLYFPLKWIVGLWLPQYEMSLKYLVLLLPICTFDGKMQMLYNTYFKVLREEKMMMKINVFSFFISLILTFLSGYIFKNLTLVVLSMVVSIALRSIVAERYLASKMMMKMNRMLTQEVLIVLIFITSTWLLNENTAFLLTGIAYVLYLILNTYKLKKNNG